MRKYKTDELNSEWMHLNVKFPFYFLRNDSLAFKMLGHEYLLV